MRHADKLRSSTFASTVSTLRDPSRGQRAPRALGPDAALTKLSELAAAHVTARRWYPRRVDCFVGSIALYLHSYHIGIPVRLVIGIQNYPFFSHAWVEIINGTGSEINAGGVDVSNLARILEVQADRIC
ncbi:lasso peptide biosynthesis B2 protein [Jatrophihabitans sp.]|uniref:lasso peptide biosynthesis B2 protein n=1 Tax=Jatrophihabitans sp. TaxID=1932789 RepID=UPI0038CDA42C